MKPETLINNNNFEKIEEIAHNNLKPFLRREITGNQGWGLIAKMYQAMGLLLVGFALVKAFAPYVTLRETASLEGLGMGVLFTFTVLIVLHELLHAIAYLLVGARKLSFGMNLKKFLFYVQADKQVLNYKKFMIVALGHLQEPSFTTVSRFTFFSWSYSDFTGCFAAVILACCVFLKTGKRRKYTLLT